MPNLIPLFAKIVQKHLFHALKIYKIIKMIILIVQPDLY